MANLDVYAGELSTLLDLLAHLLIAFWLPNPLKRGMVRWLRHPRSDQRPPRTLISSGKRRCARCWNASMGWNR